MIQWLSLVTAAVWVDFAVVVLSKFLPLTKALGEWYAQFGVAAAGADVLILVLGIALAQLISPGIHGWALVQLAVLIQIVHDLIFYGIILAVPAGQNAMIDVFKSYVGEGGWKILAADSAMIVSSVVLMEFLNDRYSNDVIGFVGALGIYSLLFIIYTK